MGKTALLKRFSQPEHTWDAKDSVSTIGVDFVKRLVRVEGKSVMLQSWDTAGQERFRTVTTAYYRGAMGAIVCYDSTLPSSLLSAKTWVKEFKERASP